MRVYAILLVCVLAALFLSRSPLKAQDDCLERTGLEDGTGITIPWWFPRTGLSGDDILTGLAQRFESPQPESLTFVIVQLRVPASTAYFGSLEGYDSSSSNGLIVSIWPDDGTGAIDNSAGPLATRTLPGGINHVYAQTGNIEGAGDYEFLAFNFGSENLVFHGSWHVSVESTSPDTTAGLLVFEISHPDLNFGDGGSVLFRPATVSSWELSTESETWRTDGLGVPFDLFVRPQLCSPGSCCVGETGNVDMDPRNRTDVGDLTVLIDHLFLEQAALPCPKEANADGSADQVVDVGDLTALIDFLFLGGESPAICL